MTVHQFFKNAFFADFKSSCDKQMKISTTLIIIASVLSESTLKNNNASTRVQGDKQRET